MGDTPRATWSIKRRLHHAQRDAQYSKHPKRKYSVSKYNSKKRGLQFLLSFEEYEALLKNNCYYCNKQIDESGFSLDRVDNSIGYVITNVVPCCMMCNRMKGTQPFDYFVNKIVDIYKSLLHKGITRRQDE